MNNIFNFATSELSQDAFLCYLFNFASEEHREEDRHLQECAVDILSKIVKSRYSSEIEDENLTVTKLEKQYKNIDVYIQVNNKYHIILEDKTYTSQHSDQIKRYKKMLEEEGKGRIITVYYKIIGQAHPEDVNVNITRNDMLRIMSPYIDKSNNTIFSNYYYYLMNLEKRVKEFETLPIKKWSGDQYRGFFNFLTHEESSTVKINLKRNYGWDYVPNPSGGFHGFWWYFSTTEELKVTGLDKLNVEDLYLQIEDNKIVIKIVSKEKINGLKWDIYNFLSQPDIIPDLKKKRFRNGNVMSIGYIEYDENSYKEKIEIMENALNELRHGNYRVTE